MSVLLYSVETWAVVKQHISPLAVFQMNCLRRICGIFLRDHVPHVDILNRCNTLSVESQLQGKRLRWLGHVFRMPNDRLPKKLLFDQVKGLRPRGRPRSSFNDVAMHDCQTRRITRPYRDAQDRLLLERQDLSCTYLAHHELESVKIIIYYYYIDDNFDMLNMLFSSFTENQYVINEDKDKVRNCCQWVYLAICQELEDAQTPCS